MISHHIYLSVALAHKESQMEAARQAHQARSLRRLARTSHPRSSFLSQTASRRGALNYADGHGVGTARYVRDADDPQAAEIAVTVVDDRQGLGAGTKLLTQLPGRGRREGIRRSTALVSADKTAMTGLLRNMSAEIAGRGARGVRDRAGGRASAHPMRTGPEQPQHPASRSRRRAEMKPRLWLTRHLGAPANAEPAAQADDWLPGQADLLIAGMGGQAPAVTQLGFLAHTDLGRLASRADVSTRAGVISHQRNQLPLPGPRRRPERRPRASGSTA